NFAPFGADVILTRGRQSLDALTGHTEREMQRWLQEVNSGKMSLDTYRKLLEERQRQTAWAGDGSNGSDSVLNRFRMAGLSGLEFIAKYAGSRISAGVGGKIVDKGFKPALQEGGKKLLASAGLEAIGGGAQGNLDSRGDIVNTIVSALTAGIAAPAGDVGLGM